MGLFDMFSGGSTPQFTPQQQQLDPAMLQQLQGDIGGVRSMANTPVTGVNAAGQAGQDLATTAYNNQMDALGGQNASNLATGMSAVGRFGADAGSAERMARANQRQGMLGQQKLGAANMENQANIGFQNIQGQEQNRVNAQMNLPSMSQNVLGMQSNVDASNIAGQNQAALGNMAADESKKQGMAGMFGGIGGALGTVYGGPVGGALGNAGGQALAGLFS